MSDRDRKTERDREKTERVKFNIQIHDSSKTMQVLLDVNLHAVPNQVIGRERWVDEGQ